MDGNITMNFKNKKHTQMKITTGILLLSTTIILTSCGSSISSDAQKVANLQCKVKKLKQKAMSGNASSMQEAQEFISEAAILVQEMNRKYASIEEKQEFQTALAKATTNCN